MVVRGFAASESIVQISGLASVFSAQPASRFALNPAPMDTDLPNIAADIESHRSPMRSSPRLLKTLLNIQSGEGQVTALVFACSFMRGITSVTFNTAAYTIFLTGFDASVLSYFSVVAATLSGFLYTRLFGQARLSPV
jgi:hypothetical protein